MKNGDCLKGLIDSGKSGHNRTHERVDKASNEIINKTHTEYMRREIAQKGEKTAKALENMSLICIPLVFLGLFKLGMLKNYVKTLK